LPPDPPPPGARKLASWEQPSALETLMVIPEVTRLPVTTFPETVFCSCSAYVLALLRLNDTLDGVRQTMLPADGASQSPPGNPLPATKVVPASIPDPVMVTDFPPHPESSVILTPVIVGAAAGVLTGGVMLLAAGVAVQTSAD